MLVFLVVLLLKARRSYFMWKGIEVKQTRKCLVNHIWERERYRISSPSSWQYLMNKLWTLPQNLQIPGEHFHFHFQIQKLLMTTLQSKFFSPFCYQPILVSQRADSSPYGGLYKCILLSSKKECRNHAKKDNIVKECTCDEFSQTLKQILALSIINITEIVELYCDYWKFCYDLYCIS